MLLRSAPKSFFVKDLLVQRCVNAIEGLTFSYGTKQTEKTEKLPMETTVIGHSSESKIKIKKANKEESVYFVVKTALPMSDSDKYCPDCQKSERKTVSVSPSD